MHDFSISRQIAGHVVKKANEERASRVVEIRIRIGGLTHLNPEQLKFWLKEFFRETVAREAKIKIEKAPIIIQCESCGYEGEVEAAEKFNHFPLFTCIHCPRCQSTEIKIKTGKECLLERMKIKR